MGLWLALLPLVVNLGLLARVAPRATESRAARLLTLFLASMIVWLLADVAARSIVDEPTAHAWRSLLRPGQFFAVATGVHFALCFAGRSDLADRTETLAVLYGPAVLGPALYAGGWLPESLVPARTWGWVAAARADGFLGALLAGWYTASAVGALAVLHVHTRRSRGVHRQTAQWVAWAAAVSVSVALLTEGLLPALGLGPTPLAATALSVFAVASWAGLRRRRVLDFDDPAAVSELVRHAGDAMMVFDRHGQLRLANPAARRMFGLEGGAAQRVDDLFRSPLEARTFLAGAWARALAGAHLRDLPLTLEDPHGSALSCLVTLSAARRGRRRVVALRVRDISEQLEVEAELHRARVQVDQARATDGPWIAHLSDELREPVHTILGCVQLMSAAPEDGSARQDLLQRVEASASQLQRLLSDVIDISRIESGTLEQRPESVDLAQTIRALSPLCRQLVKPHDNEIDVVASTPARASADPARVRQVVLGVVGFLTHVAHRQTIRIEAYPQADQACMRFELPRTTLGESQLAAALDRVPRGGGDKPPRLALSLCRRLCQVMGGELTALSDISYGTRFAVRLPRDSAA